LELYLLVVELAHLCDFWVYVILVWCSNKQDETLEEVGRTEVKLWGRKLSRCSRATKKLWIYDEKRSGAAAVSRVQLSRRGLH
jgi:hypothetical protein